MRRRRQVLQVSTFPFLAVLLCAMGSLILMLLVLDRRARAVALARARQAASSAAAEDARTAEARAAEWERRRQALHAELVQQDQAVRAQVQSVRADLASTAEGGQVKLAHYLDLQKRIETERSRLTAGEKDLTSHKQQAGEAEKQTEASRAELARLAGDLWQLEQTLDDLKALRQRQQETYSVVPYRGKQGENRRPLYVECGAAGLLFHPDRLAVADVGQAAAAVRAEVEKRIARQQEKPAAASAGAKAAPYLLMLVRPDGITTYYQTLAALRGLELDFGYEFIEQDWVLDFPDKEEESSRQPWMAEAKHDPVQPGTSAPGKVSGLKTGPADPPRGRVPGVAFNGGTAGEPGLPGGMPGGSGRPSLGFDSTGPGHAGGTATSPPRGGGSGDGNTGPGHAGGTATSPPGSGSFAGGTATGGQSPGLSGASPLLASGLPTAQANGDGQPTGSLLLGSGQSRNASGALASGDGQPYGPDVSVRPGGNSVATTGSVPSPLPATLSLSPAGTTSGDTAGGTGSPSGPVGNGTAGATLGGSPLATPGAGPASETGSPGSVAAAPGQAASGGTARSSASGSGGPPRAAGSGGSGHAPGETGQGGENEPGASPPENPFARLAPRGPAGKAVRVPAVGPARLTGNRDWIITVECAADAVVLQPARLRIPTSSLTSDAAGDNPLQRAVRDMIARRQASVRPGEIPYRPQVRFLVGPDGLRSYYLAYPALGALEVPMTRENLQPEDTRKPAGSQR